MEFRSLLLDESMWYCVGSSFSLENTKLADYSGRSLKILVRILVFCGPQIIKRPSFFTIPLLSCQLPSSTGIAPL